MNNSLAQFTNSVYQLVTTRKICRGLVTKLHEGELDDFRRGSGILIRRLTGLEIITYVLRLSILRSFPLAQSRIKGHLAEEYKICLGQR